MFQEVNEKTKDLTSSAGKKDDSINAGFLKPNLGATSRVILK